MDALYITLILLASLIIGYLFGSISNGILLGKILFKKDPRDYGSHNSGGTNVGRTFGKKIGLICIILDILKTIINIIANSYKKYQLFLKIKRIVNF